jgi:hypothetical protein
MSEEVDYFKEKLNKLNKNRAIVGGCILLVVLVGLGYLGISRPVIVMDIDQADGVYVKNNGGMDALIYKVDGFWYWAGQVALLANMPDIHQRVGSGAAPVKLQIPDIPIFDKQAAQQGACYMKLAVRYMIPGIPIFRYTTPLYFEYAPDLKVWTATKGIPPKYRALGNLAVGNIGKIELSFPCGKPR